MRGWLHLLSLAAVTLMLAPPYMALAKRLDGPEVEILAAIAAFVGFLLSHFLAGWIEDFIERIRKK